MVAPVNATRIMTSAMLGLATANQAMAAGPTRSPASIAAVRAADAWVTLLDEQRWDGSWASAGALFHGQVTRARWAAMIRPARQPVGVVVARALKTVTEASSLPGAPDGHYAITQYATRFARKQEAIETVILAREGADWKVAGYFLR